MIVIVIIGLTGGNRRTPGRRMGRFSSKIIVSIIGLIAITVIAIGCVNAYRLNEEPTFAKNEMPVFAALEFDGKVEMYDGQAEEYASDYGTRLGNVDIERFTLVEKHPIPSIENGTISQNDETENDVRLLPPIQNTDMERFTLVQKHTTKEIEEYTQQVEEKIFAEDISDENTV
jgi:hypothetical protein